MDVLLQKSKKISARRFWSVLQGHLCHLLLVRAQRLGFAESFGEDLCFRHTECGELLFHCIRSHAGEAQVVVIGAFGVSMTCDVEFFAWIGFQQPSHDFELFLGARVELGLVVFKVERERFTSGGIFHDGCVRHSEFG